MVWSVAGATESQQGPRLCTYVQDARAAKMLLIDNIAANTQLDRMSRGG